MLEHTIILAKRGIKLNNPVLIVGLPGIGNVGKLVVEHLKREFKATRIATMYSPHFPHQVVMLKSGRVRLVSNRFYCIKSKSKGGNDIVLLTGDAQAVTPEGQYEVNAKIVDFFKGRLGGKFVYTIGGYSTGEAIVREPRVFANATSKNVISRFNDAGIVFGQSRGVIWGSAGLITAFAKMSGIEAICLMGETGFLDVDASAAKAVMVKLAKKLDLDVNMVNLDKIITKTAEAVRELEAQGGMGVQIPFAPGGEGKPGERPSYIR